MPLLPSNYLSLTYGGTVHIIDDNCSIHTGQDICAKETRWYCEWINNECDDKDWFLTIIGSNTQNNSSDQIKIGVCNSCQDGFRYGEDEFDHPNPIRPDFIDMHIDRFDWVGISDNHGIMVESPYFSSDVRPISEVEDFQAWNISAEAYNVLGDVRLSWSMTDEIESDLHLVIKGEAYNLKELASIDVPNTSLDNMVLVVGDIYSFLAPEEFALSAAYPNPFNPSTSLDLSLNHSGNVNVKVYNVVGQVVTTLANGHMNAGYHTLTWDASSMASGMYFIKVETGSNVAVQKIMLMK